MQYKAIGFDPPGSRDATAEYAASQLGSLISSQAADGWEFVELSNHSTIVPGSMGCFGLGKTDPYQVTVSIAVFRK